MLWTAAITHVAAGAFTHANESNVWGGAYALASVHNATRSVLSAAECEAACAAEATCRSYTWTPGSHLSGVAPDRCKYTHNCWWRSDATWNLKVTRDCTGLSGYKGAAPRPTPPSPAPKGALNVLFVIFDDLRVTHKTWGFEQSHTPRTDALATKSLIFDNAYCQQAVCGPSRASLLSGRRPDTTEMWNFIGGFRKNAPGAAAWNTWPEWFKKHGYASHGVGKLWHPDDPANFDPQSWSNDTYGGYFGQDHCPHGAENQSTHGEYSFMYRYIPREYCSQFDCSP